MNEGLISRRYAKALLNFAEVRNNSERLYYEAKMLEQYFIEHPELRKTLLTPVLSAHDKELLLSSAIDDVPSEEFLRFVRLVIRNRRESYMRSIGLMYQKLYRLRHNITQLNIITAIPLNEQMVNKIKLLVEKNAKSKVEFIYRVDPAIIGGFILQYNAMRMDASVNNELKSLRFKLLNNRKS